ncbi:MAG: hypothetical protein IJ638_01720 [Alphaproteobacteria bacterium]|nr:hypothetical protein [Alphaproteobacteria bacterium]
MKLRKFLSTTLLLTSSPAMAQLYICEACPAGTYSDGTATSCTNCPANSTAPVGSGKIGDCTCNSGYDRIGDACIKSCPVGAICDEAGNVTGCKENYKARSPSGHAVYYASISYEANPCYSNKKWENYSVCGSYDCCYDIKEKGKCLGRANELGSLDNNKWKNYITGNGLGCIWGGISSCTCPIGYYIDAAGNCKVVPEGYYNEKENSTSYTICPLGSYCTGGKKNVCDVGSYTNKLGQSSCTKCAYGYTTDSTGSTSANDCRLAKCKVWSCTATSSCYDCKATKEKCLNDRDCVNASVDYIKSYEGNNFNVSFGTCSPYPSGYGCLQNDINSYSTKVADVTNKKGATVTVQCIRDGVFEIK